LAGDRISAACINVRAVADRGRRQSIAIDCSRCSGARRIPASSRLAPAGVPTTTCPWPTTPPGSCSSTLDRRPC